MAEFPLPDLNLAHFGVKATPKPRTTRGVSMQVLAKVCGRLGMLKSRVARLEGSGQALPPIPRSHSFPTTTLLSRTDGQPPRVQVRPVSALDVDFAPEREERRMRQVSAGSVVSFPGTPGVGGRGRKGAGDWEIDVRVQDEWQDPQHTPRPPLGRLPPSSPSSPVSYMSLSSPTSIHSTETTIDLAAISLLSSLLALTPDARAFLDLDLPSDDWAEPDDAPITPAGFLCRGSEGGGYFGSESDREKGAVGLGLDLGIVEGERAWRS